MGGYIKDPNSCCWTNVYDGAYSQQRTTGKEKKSGNPGFEAVMDFEKILWEKLDIPVPCIVAGVYPKNFPFNLKRLGVGRPSPGQPFYGMPAMLLHIRT